MALFSHHPPNSTEGLNDGIHCRAGDISRIGIYACNDAYICCQLIFALIANSCLIHLKTLFSCSLIRLNALDCLMRSNCSMSREELHGWHAAPKRRMASPSELMLGPMS